MSPPPANVLAAPVAIVGAGWLGRALAHTLTCPVVATTRSGLWGEPTVPKHVAVTALDVTASDADFRAVAAAPNVVVSYAPGPSTGRSDTDQARHRLYVEGTRAVLAALSPTARLVFVGSTSALAAHEGWVDESCNAAPQAARGRTQRDAETIVLRREGSSIVLRMGGLFGPGRELERLYRNRPASAPRPGDGMAATNLVHRDDAVAAIVAALTRPNVRGIVHVVADGHTARRTMYGEIASRTGVPAPSWSQDSHGTTPHGKRVSNLRLKLQLGVRLAYPLTHPLS